jgi:hypothetical protein
MFWKRPMLKLPNVTLVVVTSVKIEDNISAMVKSMSGIEYGAVKFFCHIKPNLPIGVGYVECEKLDYIGFSRYTFLELWKNIETDFCLLVHHDGYVSNPDNWDDRFLNFDYIGAPWPYSEDSYITDYGEHVRVGNAGVCIRSKKILKMPTDLGLRFEHRQGFYNDDGNFCVYHRKTFLENGIRYAPIELASKFSKEIWIDGISRNDTFAFHGDRNR